MEDKKNKPIKIGKIEVDRDMCIGAGPCVTFAPATFELDSEGKAIVKGLGLNTTEEIVIAAMSCPVLAIKIYDTEGNLIYPK
jgi:ferredoxin